MSVGLLIITHGDVGHALLDTASAMLSGMPLQSEAVTISNQCDPDAESRRVGVVIAKLNRGDGVLILTDIYGATPSNIAMKYQDEAARVMVVSGVNLPMLIRVLNYPDLSIEQLLEKALSGGRDGVFRCQREEG